MKNIKEQVEDLLEQRWKYTSEIDKQIKELQAQCSHSNLVGERINFADVDDVDFFCPDCHKQWDEEWKAQRLVDGENVSTEGFVWEDRTNS